MDKDAIEQFYKDHGDHMKQVMQNTVETKRKRDLFVKIKDQKFTSGGTIKTYCKRMIIKYKNWSKISASDAEFLNEIVKYHPNPDKFKDTDSYTSGPHPEYSENKCF